MSCCLTLMSSYCGLSARDFCTCFVFECPLVCVCRVSRGVGMFDVCVELFLIDC